MSTQELAKERTRLSNQRTYLAYIRTGLAISAISSIFKKKWIFTFGILMIVISTLQYYLLLNSINNNKIKNNWVHYMPLMYIILSIGVLYLQYIKQNVNVKIINKSKKKE